MKASIIIITKNQKGHLQKTLPILLSQEFDDKYEIIVVDSGSTDGAIKYIESLPVHLVKIEPKEFKFAKAFNIGTKNAKGDYLIRLSGDAIPIGDTFLLEMVQSFKDKTVGGVYGMYTITGREGYTYPDFWSADRFPKDITRYKATPTFMMGVNFFGLEFGDDKVREYAFNFAGGCCAIRRSVWMKRPFNENLIGGEDAEYAYFLHLIGYNIVCNPEAKVIHEHKIKANRENSWHGNLGLSIWRWVFNWEIAKYWIQKTLLKDPYSNLKFD